MNEAFDDLLRAMKRAREALYNGFEPDNQSRAYHDADDAIKKAGLARCTVPEGRDIGGLLHAARNAEAKLTYLGRQFCSTNFTDRYGDGPMMLGIADDLKKEIAKHSSPQEER
jgi:hypothetical protein